MTPKEMATKLYNDFYNTSHHSNSTKIREDVAKNSAKICVKYIIDICNNMLNSDFIHFKETAEGEFWLSVDNEIKKL